MTSLYFKYSAITSGKATLLLETHYNYLERGMKPVAITAKSNINSAGEGVISAPIGVNLPAHIFDAETDVLKMLHSLHSGEAVDAVLIDDAHLLSENQVMQCASIVDDLNIPVLCYGVKTDYQGRLFSGAEALLRYADNIEEIKSVCWCGRKATQNARIDELGNIQRTSDNLILIDGREKTTALCRKHFMKGQTKPSKQDSKIANSDDGEIKTCA